MIENIKYGILFLLVLLISIPITSALEYSATLESRVVANINGNNSFDTPFTKTLNISDSWTITGTSVTIKYYQFDETAMAVWFKVTGGSSDDQTLIENQEKCFKGNCANLSLSSIGDVKVKLIKLTRTSPITTSTSTVSASSNTVDVYLLPSTGEKLFLDKSIPKTYDSSTYNTKSGWTSAGSEKEIYLYIHKNSPSSVSYTMTTTGTYKGEEQVDSDTIRYLLQSNDVYTLNLKTTRVSALGGNIEESNNYVVTVKGLTSTSSSSKIIIPSAYDVTKGETKQFTLPDGTFSADSSFSFAKQESDNGNVIWNIGFKEPGTYKLTYTPKIGSQIDFSFNVKNPSSTPTPTLSPEEEELSKLTGNQEDAVTGPEDSSGNRVIIIIIIAILILLAGVLIWRSKSKGTGRGRGRGSSI